jgi:hypothetical protein
MNNNEPLNYFSVFVFSKPLNYLNTNLVEITNHQVCSKSNTTGGICGAGIVYPSGAHDFKPFSVGWVLLDL